MNKITEGRAEILVPAKSLTKKAETFFNPEMGHQRDITMSGLRIYQKMAGHGLSICDPLAGTGVRSVRISLEVPGIDKITINDSNPRAFALIKKNWSMNKPNKRIGIDITNKRANVLFLENQKEFDYIDIDPFGSPINFVFNAGYALKSRSLLACTATDTGALCGAFPSTCFTRYGIKAVKTDFFKETGVRVLITAIMLELARHDMAFDPMYSHSNHYFRVIGKVRRSKGMVSAQFRQIGFLAYCQSCLYRSTAISGECPNCGKKISIIGPLWLGKIKETGFCKKMLADMRSNDCRRTKELDTSLLEIDSPGYYGMPRLFRVLKKAPAPLEHVMKTLKSKGYEASRTHLSPNGIKTDAPYEEVVDAAGG
jgi:tRNA (guanine26-N2/guanine27-N2)-dimethyltransferase